MPIRMRPAEVNIPDENPFRNDLLDRESHIEKLTSLLGALEGPCVFALDSKWGGGKTTFLNMWAAHLRNSDYSVAQFNAWETDFTGDPFVALSSRLYEHFAESTDSGPTKLESYMKAAKNFAIKSTPFIIGLATLAATGSGTLSGELAAQIESFAEKRLAGFSETQKSIQDFKKILQQEVSELYDSKTSRPLFIMIDELDRCRPSYAIELLEVAKHLFSVDRIVFVLALNKSELAHSVKALYGNNFDADGYLHRFIDLDYSLPWPDREKFVLQALRDSNLDALFHDGPLTFEVVPTLIARLLAWSHLDLRRIGQASRRMALTCASLGDTPQGIAAGLCIALVVRALDSKLYQEFRDGDIPDSQVIDRLYECGDLRNLRHTPQGYFLDAAISVMWCEFSGKADAHADKLTVSPYLINCVSTKQRLDSRAREIQAGSSRGQWSDADREQLSQAHGVVHVAKVLSNTPSSARYDSIIKYIELLPSSGA